MYDDAWGTGANGRYHIAGFAAFYLTGYFLPSAHPTSDSPYNSAIRCRGSDKCIYGWFTQGLIPNPGTIGGGTGMGAKVVTLAG